MAAWTWPAMMYGVEIGRVQGIIRMQAITRVPNGLAFFEGVTNPRGWVIPVRPAQALCLEATAPTRRSRIVVAELGEHTVVPLDGLAAAIVCRLALLPERTARRA